MDDGVKLYSDAARAPRIANFQCSWSRVPGGSEMVNYRREGQRLHHRPVVHRAALLLGRENTKQSRARRKNEIKKAKTEPVKLSSRPASGKSQVRYSMNKRPADGISSGLDLNPAPPSTARIRKKSDWSPSHCFVGWRSSSCTACTRARNSKRSPSRERGKSLSPHAPSGYQVVREIAPPAVANPRIHPKGMSGIRLSAEWVLVPSDKPMLRPPSISSRTDEPSGPAVDLRETRRRSMPLATQRCLRKKRLRLAAFRDEQQQIAFAYRHPENGALNISPSVGASSDPLQAYSALASLLGVTRSKMVRPDGASQTPVVAPTSNGVDGQNGQIQRSVPSKKTRARAVKQTI